MFSFKKFVYEMAFKTPGSGKNDHRVPELHEIKSDDWSHISTHTGSGLNLYKHNKSDAYIYSKSLNDTPQAHFQGEHENDGYMIHHMGRRPESPINGTDMSYHFMQATKSPIKSQAFTPGSQKVFRNLHAGSKKLNTDVFTKGSISSVPEREHNFDDLFDSSYDRFLYARIRK